MMYWKLGVLLLALCCAEAAAATTTLTLDQALALARERSPVLQAARQDADRAVGAARGALLPNPVVSGGLVARDTVDGLEPELGLAQPLPLVERLAERGAARARAAASADWAADAERQVLAQVSADFLRVRHADARTLVAEQAAVLAGKVLAATRSRVDVGEASAMKLSAATLAQARAGAALASERASQAEALGALRISLGVKPATELEPVGPILSPERYAPLLSGSAPTRADLAALAEQLTAAQAEQRFARAQALPELGVWAQAAQEEGQSVTAAGLSLELPLFDRAQRERAVAKVRLQQAETALRARHGAAKVQLDTAIAVYRLRLEAFELLASVAVPRAQEQSAAASRAYELGELPLPELLLVRGQVSLALVQHADAELDAALAGVRLLEVAGWTP